MHLSPRWITVIKRGAASWWSIVGQVVILMFNATCVAFLFIHHSSYVRGVIPASLFQSPDEMLFYAMEPDQAMNLWYFMMIYFGISLPVLVFSLWYCGLLRRRLHTDLRSADP